MRIQIAAIAFIVVLGGSTVSLAQFRTFGGNDCTDDCSGHRAGYEWAEQNAITDESECGGNSTASSKDAALTSKTRIEGPMRTMTATT